MKMDGDESMLTVYENDRSKRKLDNPLGMNVVRGGNVNGLNMRSHDRPFSPFANIIRSFGK